MGSGYLQKWAAIFSGLVVCGPIYAQTNPINKGNITIKLTPFVTIPSSEGAAQAIAPVGNGNLLITTRNGQIRVVNSSGTFLDSTATPFLDVAAKVGGIDTRGEGGLPGLALSPNFATDHKFYTFDTGTFTANSPAADFGSPELKPTTSTNPNNQIYIREWQVNPATGLGNPSSERTLMTMNHPQNNHQGGQIAFGPDNMLYIGLGDGGGGNDFNGTFTSNTDGHENNFGNAQDITASDKVVMGKILRIDPNPADAGGALSANGQYRIPANNPFVGQPTKTQEVYTYGHRNPYRFSFDAGGTHAMYVGDVGQDTQEEVDIINSGGGNYGWPFREGFATSTIRPTTPAGFTPLPPAAAYINSAANNGGGNSIIGGFVYRGSLIPELTGKYVFGDLSGAGNNVGKILYMDATGGTISEMKYDPTGLSPSMLLYGFGQDANNELYAMFSDGANNNQILRLVPEPTTIMLLTLLAMPLGLRRRA